MKSWEIVAYIGDAEYLCTYCSDEEKDTPIFASDDTLKDGERCGGCDDVWFEGEWVGSKRTAVERLKEAVYD